MASRAVSQARTKPVVTVLIVLGTETSALRAILQHSNWRIQTAADFDQAAWMVRVAPPSVVIAPHRVAGAIKWPQLLEVLQESDSPSRLIVTDRYTDDALWAEALNLGAHDVLAQPFDSVEVFRVVTAAWSASRHATAGAGKALCCRI